MSLDIALVRVDNRLIHGQILEAWVPFIKAACIVVADDMIAGDLFRAMVIRIAVPRDVEVIVSGVEDFARKYPYRTGQGKKTLVLFSSISDAVKAFQAGFKFAKLNLGNVHDVQGEAGRRQCSSCVFLSDVDICDLRNLINTGGVQVELRRVPQEAPVDARDVVPI